MGIERATAWGAKLLLSIVVSGCAAQVGTVDNEAVGGGKVIGSYGKAETAADGLREFQAVPADERRRILDGVLASQPDDFLARVLRVGADYELNDVEAVIEDSQLVLADPRLERNQRLVVLQYRADALVIVRRFDEGIAVANQALEIDPSSAQALLSRGWGRFFVDQEETALADLDRAVEMLPNDGIGYFRRGTVFDRRGKFSLALKDLKRAIELAPADGHSHRQYGVTLYETGDLAQALAQFDAAAALMPNDALSLTWRAQTNLALKHVDAAIADDNRAKRLGATDEDLVDTFNEVGLVLDEQKDFAGAARLYERAIALKEDPVLANVIARTLWFSGQFGRAAESFRQHGVAPMSGDYKPLWLYVVQGRANPVDEPVAKAQLASAVQPHQPHAWTDTLVSMLLGRTTLEAALVEADAAKTDLLRAGRRCEADYYAAEQMLMHQQVETANRLLEEAYWVCPATYSEADAVIAERRLQVARSLTR